MALAEGSSVLLTRTCVGDPKRHEWRSDGVVQRPAGDRVGAVCLEMMRSRYGGCTTRRWLSARPLENGPRADWPTERERLAHNEASADLALLLSQRCVSFCSRVSLPIAVLLFQSGLVWLHATSVVSFAKHFSQRRLLYLRSSMHLPLMPQRVHRHERRSVLGLGTAESKHQRCASRKVLKQRCYLAMSLQFDNAIAQCSIDLQWSCSQPTNAALCLHCWLVSNSKEQTLGGMPDVQNAEEN